MVSRLAGNPAVVGPESRRPEALRPRLSPGLPFISGSDYRAEAVSRQGTIPRASHAETAARDYVNLPGGRPTFKLSGGALKRLETMVPEGYEGFVHVSLTDDPPMAQAFVIIEARPQR